MGCFCALPVLIGFVFPVIIMLQMVIETVDLNAIAQTLPYLKNTFLRFFGCGLRCSNWLYLHRAGAGKFSGEHEQHACAMRFWIRIARNNSRAWFSFGVVFF